MESEIYLIFMFTTAIVILAPGPAAIAIAAQGAGNGHRRATFGVFGVAAANAVYFILSATGIASLLIA
jgi:threonine/homoserine/homoserine lactone efflux protein